MLNKKLTILIAGAIIVAGVLINGVLSNQKKPMKRRPVNQTNKQVKIVTVKNEAIRTEFDISGHIRALDKVEMYAEVSGILLNTPKRFKEGNRFSTGEALIKIDDSVYRNNVLAKKSSLLNQLTLLLPDLSIDFPASAPKWEHYLQQYDLEKTLSPIPVPGSDQEKYYIASRNIYDQYYTIKSMEATLAKYAITAPYAGVVTESNINPGTLVRAGQKLGEFTNTAIYELEAFASVHQVQHLKPGDPVTLFSDDMPYSFQGKIQRINAIIDPSSQTVKVYITTRDQGLKEGMYCTANILSEPIENAIRLPRNILVGHDKVYTVNDSTLALQHIDIVENENDQVIVQGLVDGTMILGQPLTNAYDGMKLTQIALN